MKTLKYVFKRIGIAFIIGLVGFGGYVVGIYKNTQDFHKILIEHSFAEYNSVTGVWQYKSIDDIVDSQPSLFDMPSKKKIAVIVDPETPNIVTSSQKKTSKKS